MQNTNDYLQAYLRGHPVTRSGYMIGGRKIGVIILDQKFEDRN